MLRVQPEQTLEKKPSLTFPADVIGSDVDFYEPFFGCRESFSQNMGSSGKRRSKEDEEKEYKVDFIISNIAGYFQKNTSVKKLFITLHLHSDRTMIY